ncbi:MAG: DUF883 family protein [Alkalilacustris sp.]
MAAKDDGKDGKAAEAPTVEDLNRQMEALREDVAAIAETLKALGRAQGKAAAEGVREKADEARAAGEAQVEALRRSLEAILAEADSAARQKPVTAMGIAAGFGFLIGLLLARR